MNYLRIDSIDWEISEFFGIRLKIKPEHGSAQFRMWLTDDDNTNYMIEYQSGWISEQNA